MWLVIGARLWSKPCSLIDFGSKELLLMEWWCLQVNREGGELECRNYVQIYIQTFFRTIQIAI